MRPLRINDERQCLLNRGTGSVYNRQNLTRYAELRLQTDAAKVVSISWSKFDDLWIAADLSLPFSGEDTTVRWVRNSIETLQPMIGAEIRSAMLGRGQMSVEGPDIEIWTRLAIQVGNGWAEIFNALDENGYDFHDQRPAGEFLVCT